MTARAFLIGAALSSLVANISVHAQGFGSFDFSGQMALAAMQQNDIMGMVIDQQYGSKREETRSQLRAALPSTFRYTPTAKVALDPENTYIARLMRENRTVADALKQQMRAHDFGHVYTGIIAPFGLRRGDIGDATTAYTLLGWMIATGSTDPRLEQVHGMRERIAAGLAAIGVGRNARRSSRRDVGGYVQEHSG